MRGSLSHIVFPEPPTTVGCNRGRQVSGLVSGGGPEKALRPLVLPLVLADLGQAKPGTWQEWPTISVRHTTPDAAEDSVAAAE